MSVRAGELLCTASKECAHIVSNRGFALNISFLKKPFPFVSHFRISGTCRRYAVLLH